MLSLMIALFLVDGAWHDVGTMPEYRSDPEDSSPDYVPTDGGTGRAMGYSDPPDEAAVCYALQVMSGR